MVYIYRFMHVFSLHMYTYGMGVGVRCPVVCVLGGWVGAPFATCPWVGRHHRCNRHSLVLSPVNWGLLRFYSAQAHLHYEKRLALLAHEQCSGRGPEAADEHARLALEQR